MGRSDMVVQLSVWENCSYTLLDAKSAGLKVVATAVGGNPEVVSARELVERSSPNLTEQVFSRMHALLLEGPSEQFPGLIMQQWHNRQPPYTRTSYREEVPGERHKL